MLIYNTIQLREFLSQFFPISNQFQPNFADKFANHQTHLNPTRKPFPTDLAQSKPSVAPP